jgi:peptidyl-prolyl cis-trans isomerase C
VQRPSDHRPSHRRALALEVVAPAPTEDERRRCYEAHPQDFRNGDLVQARHILFQATPSVRITEIRARAEQTLNRPLREPERFAAAAAKFSNCPSGQHGGDLGQIGRGDTVPEFERRCFTWAGPGCCPNWSRPDTGSTSSRWTGAFQARRCRSASRTA